MCEKNKIAFWAKGLKTVEFLLPKKSGLGFLKTPLGHHMTDIDAEWYHKIDCDVSGIEGTLSFETGYLSDDDLIIKVKEFSEIIQPRFKFSSVKEIGWNSMFYFLNSEVSLAELLKQKSSDFARL